MLPDDLDPPRKPPELLFRKLDTLSVAALEQYIRELEVEVLRAREEIKRRGGAKAAAEALFGGKK